MSADRSKGWLVDLAVGVLAGGIVGVIVAVNFVIYIGITGGYEASLADVFRQSPVAGVVTVILLVGGPVIGVWAARRWRRARRPGDSGSGTVPSGN